MKKSVSLALLLFHLIILNGVANYGAIFTAIEPSSINRALGMNTGSVNIWHNSPLMNYTNPAIGSFHEGFSYNFTNDKWFDQVPGLEDLYYNAAMLSFGYKGISITLPFYNGSKMNDKFGLTMSYGEQEEVDENGNTLGYFETYETAQVYGLGFNMIEMYRNFYNNEIQLLNYFDLAVGANFASIKSDFAYNTENSKGIGEASKLDIGAIARFSYEFNNIFNLELVYGVSHFNIKKNEISYSMESQKDMVFRNRNQGFAYAVSLLSNNYFSDIIADKYLFFENILSLRYLQSYEDDFQSNPKIESHGSEIGFFDTIFIRYGNYDDTAGSVKGKTFGIGINLHYRKIVAFTYNYAEFPGGQLQKNQTSSDFTLNANFIKLFNLVRN